MPTTVRAIATGTEELVSRTRKTKAAETSRTMPPMSRFLFTLTFSFLGSLTTSRPNDFDLSTPVPRWNRFGTTSPEVGLCRILAMGPGVLVIKLTRVRPAMLTVCNQERFLSSQSRQLVEEQRPKTSPHLACEGAEGTPSTSSTTPSAPRVLPKAPKGASLRRLEQALHLLPPRTPPRRNGRAAKVQAFLTHLAA